MSQVSLSCPPPAIPSPLSGEATLHGLQVGDQRAGQDPLVPSAAKP